MERSPPRSRGRRSAGTPADAGGGDPSGGIAPRSMKGDLNANAMRINVEMVVEQPLLAAGAARSTAGVGQAADRRGRLLAGERGRHLAAVSRIAFAASRSFARTLGARAGLESACAPAVSPPSASLCPPRFECAASERQVRPAMISGTAGGVPDAPATGGRAIAKTTSGVGSIAAVIGPGRDVSSIARSHSLRTVRSSSSAPGWVIFLRSMPRLPEGLRARRAGDCGRSRARRAAGDRSADRPAHFLAGGAAIVVLGLFHVSLPSLRLRRRVHLVPLRRAPGPRRRSGLQRRQRAGRAATPTSSRIPLISAR